MTVKGTMNSKVMMWVEIGMSSFHSLMEVDGLRYEKIQEKK